MNQLAETMANRIREAVGGMARTSTDPAEGQAFMAVAQTLCAQNYGIGLDEILSQFVPQNDIVWAAAEQGISPSEFVTTLGTQFCLANVAGRTADQVAFVAGENRCKLALAEFCSQEDGDWTYSDGHAVGTIEGVTVAVSSSFVEATGGWEFSSAAYPCSKDDFIAATPEEKAGMPSEDRAYGDIGEVVERRPALEVSAPSMRM